MRKVFTIGQHNLFPPKNGKPFNCLKSRGRLEADYGQS